MAADQTGGWTRVGVVAVVAAAAISPFWNSYPLDAVPALTVGRMALVAALFGLIALLAIEPVELRAAPLALTIGAAALLGLIVVILISAKTRGCLCSGGAYGFIELAGIALAAGVAASIRPSLREPLLVGAALGAAVATILALAGVKDVHDAVGAAANGAQGGRLGGSYRNPNFLGFIIACGLPLVAARPFLVSWPRRGLAVVLFVTMVVALVETYSRGAVLAAGAGVLTAATLAVDGRRARILVLAGGATAAALTAAIALDSFNAHRRAADFGAAALGVVDASGWATTADGPIAKSGAELSGKDAVEPVLAIATTQPGQGASFRLGRIPAGQRVEVTFDAAAASGRQPLRYELEDNAKGLAPADGVGAASASGWRSFSLSWTPSQVAAQARFYIFQDSRDLQIQIRRLTLRVGGGALRQMPTRLSGRSSRDALERAAEARYVSSRVNALRGSIDAFRSAPVLGVGWERFPEWAARHLGHGQIATHDEYLRIAAELGLVGVAWLIGLIAAILMGVRDAVRIPCAAPAVGALVAGGVSLVFVNGLVTPSASEPLAVVIGLTLGARPWRRRATRSTAS